MVGILCKIILCITLYNSRLFGVFNWGRSE